MKLSPFLAAVSALLVSLAGPVEAAPDNTLGMALMSATVNGSPASPSIVRGSGAVSVIRPAQGTFDVTFNRDLSNCTCTASTGSYVLGVEATSRFAATNCPYAASSVRVTIQSFNGAMSDWPFHLIVFCPK